MEYSDLVHYADPDKTYTPLGKYKQYVQTLVTIPLKYQLNPRSFDITNINYGYLDSIVDHI